MDYSTCRQDRKEALGLFTTTEVTNTRNNLCCSRYETTHKKDPTWSNMFSIYIDKLLFTLGLSAWRQNRCFAESRQTKTPNWQVSIDHGRRLCRSPHQSRSPPGSPSANPSCLHARPHHHFHAPCNKQVRLHPPAHRQHHHHHH